MDDWEAGTSGAAMDDFDVFLNHRGPDVKPTFVAHLEDALQCAGFRPFLDARSLMKGNPALKSIDQALDMAKVHVAVVSPGYAKSKYCLNELVAMLRSGKPVIPVFYNVEPVDLRWVENGPFAEAFEEHKAKGRTGKKVGEWREALWVLAGITGFRLADYRRDEAKLKKEVVNAIARLTPSNDLVEVEACRVGLEGPTNACIQMLENTGTRVGILGLVGMGGVGKSTLAREVYNHVVAAKKFKYMTFLEIHRESPGSSNVEVRPSKSRRLRKQLLWDLLHVEGNASNYRSWFQKLSCLGPVFIVIDDVHKLVQFEELVPSASLLHAGSRILITSRDQSILKCISGSANVHPLLYHVSELNEDESNMLFNCHAFHAKDAPEDYRGVAKSVVQACGGLPLALKVVGSGLIDKKSKEDRETIWPEAVHVLRQSRDVMDVLRWSYDSLLDPEKCMFLDITCLFHNKSAKEALAYWLSCSSSRCGVVTPHTSLRNLMDKNIVEQKWDGLLGVHDLLMDLGQDIGRRAKSHLVCNTTDDGIVIANEGIEDTMALNLARSRKRKFDARNFAKMSNLHVLILPNGCGVDGDLRCISKELRWLQWRDIPFRRMPRGLNLIHLSSLDFSESTKLASTWTKSNGSLEGCPNLRFLNLSECTSITKLPDSIGQLSQLQNLNLEGCRKLEKVPESFGQLTALEFLNIRRCTTLKAFPDSLGLSSLQRVLARCCTSLVKLPTSIGLSSRLQVLDLFLCNSLKKLPKSLGRLQALWYLDLGGCTSLKALPETIGALSNLQELHALGCNSLVMLPSSLRLLPSLRNLSIEANTKCHVFSDGNFGAAWAQLRFLTLCNCDGLRSLLDYGALKSVEELKLSDNTLTELPESLGLLVGLKSLIMSDCEMLQMECLPKSLADHKVLEWVTLRNCKNLRRLPKNLGALTCLKQLVITHCPIRRVPKSISGLSQLQGLYIQECKNLLKLPTSIRHLERLQQFELSGCGSIEAKGALTTLQGLPIWGSTSLTRLPASLAMVSCLVIYGGDYDYLHLYDVSSYDVLEEDETGFLRVYRRNTGETTLVRRSHKRTRMDQLLGNSGKA